MIIEERPTEQSIIDWWTQEIVKREIFDEVAKCIYGSNHPATNLSLINLKFDRDKVIDFYKRLLRLFNLSSSNEVYSDTDKLIWWTILTPKQKDEIYSNHSTIDHPDEDWEVAVKLFNYVYLTETGPIEASFSPTERDVEELVQSIRNNLDQVSKGIATLMLVEGLEGALKDGNMLVYSFDNNGDQVSLSKRKLIELTFDCKQVKQY